MHAQMIFAQAFDISVHKPWYSYMPWYFWLPFIGLGFRAFMWLVNKLPEENKTPQKSPPKVTPPTPKTRASRSTPASNDLEARLRRLDELQNKGLITPTEYEQRRKSILDTI